MGKVSKATEGAKMIVVSERMTAIRFDTLAEFCEKVLPIIGKDRDIGMDCYSAREGGGCEISCGRTMNDKTFKAANYAPLN